MMPQIDPRPVALVLGAAVWPSGEPSPTLRRRALHAASLFSSNEVRAIVACGGLGQNPPTEAEVIARLCEEAGVPPTALALEDSSTNTMQNLTFAMPLLKQFAARDIVIVTDRYHAPRAMLTARRLGMRARASCPRLTGTRPGKIMRSYLREIPAYLWYALRG